MPRIKLLFLPFFFITASIGAQTLFTKKLEGRVYSKDGDVAATHVLNTTTKRATITDINGFFSIPAGVGDTLVFSAVQFKRKELIVSSAMLDSKLISVPLEDVLTQLDEVVVTPEQQERFLQVKNEEFKEFVYEADRSTEVDNIAMPKSSRGMIDGINFVNIFKALANSNKTAEEKRPPLKLSAVMRQVYDDVFFVNDLKLPQDKIDAFLIYCDNKMPANTLLKKENEFQLIDFLVTHSKTFLQHIDDEE